MNKSTQKIMAFVIIGVLVIAAGVYYRTTHSGNKAKIITAQRAANPKPPTTTSKSLTCDNFSALDATKLLGSTATRLASIIPEQTTKTLRVSSCTYQSQPSNGKPARVLTMLIRTNSDPVTTQKAFAALASSTQITAVSGLGDAAFLNSTKTQLNIRKGATWLVISITAAVKGQKSSSDLAKNAAAIILPKL